MPSGKTLMSIDLHSNLLGLWRPLDCFHSEQGLRKYTNESINPPHARGGEGCGQAGCHHPLPARVSPVIPLLPKAAFSGYHCLKWRCMYGTHRLGCREGSVHSGRPAPCRMGCSTQEQCTPTLERCVDGGHLLLIQITPHKTPLVWSGETKTGHRMLPGSCPAPASGFEHPPQVPPGTVQ